MKRSVLVITCLVFLFRAHSQTAAKSVFFELGGPGIASFNYDTRFGKKEAGIGGRLGFGGFNIAGYGALFVPAGVNYLIGKDNRHYFEVGGGVTLVKLYDGDDQLIDDRDGTFESTFGHLNFGYRLQPARGGFFFRATVNPVFRRNFFLPYYGGVSFGYKFGQGR